MSTKNIQPGDIVKIKEVLDRAEEWYIEEFEPYAGNILEVKEILNDGGFRCKDSGELVWPAESFEWFKRPEGGECPENTIIISIEGVTEEDPEPKGMCVDVNIRANSSVKYACIGALVKALNIDINWANPDDILKFGAQMAAYTLDPEDILKALAQAIQKRHGDTDASMVDSAGGISDEG